MSVEIHEILRASDVKRWHIVRTSLPQSVAEHTFNVTMIARAIAKAAGIPDEDITKAALAHDLDEVMSGDIPSCTKDRAQKNGWDLDQLYEHVTGRKLTSDEQTIVELADALEAHWFICANGVGSHAEKVKRDCFKRYDKMLRGSSPDIQRATVRVALLVFKGEHTI